MDNYNFTKGKWNYEKGTYLENTIFFHFNNGEIIKVSNINYNDEATEETKANAKLIATAPELLEALQNLVALKESKDKSGKDEYYLKSQPIAWENAKKAILKALNG